MIQPEFLKSGDKIAILSTARKITRAEIEPAVQLLEEWGFVPVISTTIGAEEDQFAGGVRFRESELQKHLDDTQIRAIWCARGGYGTVQLIDGIDWTGFLKSPKWICGYSDITVLHNHLNRRGFATIHSIMPIDMPRATAEAKQSFFAQLTGEKLQIEWKTDGFHKKTEVSAEIVGGNLSIIYSLCGSSSRLDTAGKILFIEDLDEYLYHVDRMMQNLKRNGYFNELKALIVGGMSDMNDNTIPYGKSAREIILNVCGIYDFPVVFNFPAGHLTDNRAIQMGSNYTLAIDGNKATLTTDGKD